MYIKTALPVAKKEIVVKYGAQNHGRRAAGSKKGPHERETASSSQTPTTLTSDDLPVGCKQQPSRTQRKEAACLRNAEEDPLWCKSHFFPRTFLLLSHLQSIPPTAWWQEEWTEGWRTVTMWHWLHNNIQLLSAQEWKYGTHRPLEEQLGTDSKEFMKTRLNVYILVLTW